MKNVPEKIFLQVGSDCPKDADFNDLTEVTHCADRIEQNDIEYQRAPRNVKAGGTEFIVIGPDPLDNTQLICVRPLKDCSKEARETHDNTIRRIPLKQIKEIK